MDKINPTQYLDSMVNQYINLDPEAMKSLSILKDKVICVEATGINQSYYISLEEEKIVIRTQCDKEPDTRIKGMPSALIKLAVQSDTAPLLLSGEIEITGDVRLGRAFKKSLAKINIDWEEHLSQVIGDVPSNLAFNAMTQLSSWTKQVASSLTEDVSEYLQEESRDVVTGAEQSVFNAGVDQLRDDVDRLAAIIKNKDS